MLLLSACTNITNVCSGEMGRQKSAVAIFTLKWRVVTVKW